MRSSRPSPGLSTADLLSCSVTPAGFTLLQTTESTLLQMPSSGPLPATHPQGQRTGWGCSRETTATTLAHLWAGPPPNRPGSTCWPGHQSPSRSLLALPPPPCSTAERRKRGPLLARASGRCARLSSFREDPPVKASVPLRRGKSAQGLHRRPRAGLTIRRLLRISPGVPQKPRRPRGHHDSTGRHPQSETETETEIEKIKNKK
ncbi:hypothetical protein VULLAG_LOCUS10572 [Vulpes lagopus]